MDLAVRTLSNFHKPHQARRVNRMRAVATSAVRETKNSADFIARIRRETGIKVEMIPAPKKRVHLQRRASRDGPRRRTASC